ncbi:hypothetical protein GCM10009841_23500 [Microlunatus panaciterrae]|uniref:DNA-binding transcriptional regulator, MarR family n=1 Tax=Microlunatus panaciterrae TaxID=400768 RepID=A0ABS2RE11_9ACTN|nr:hypothetical protein [Microlunatus panaciterrae]MBM7797231.1 hypothetical protein [Microlunatus panaciterrae]
MTAQRPLGFWLKLVDELINAQFSSTLDEHGVTRRQWQLMNVLVNGPATLAELDEAVAPFLDEATQESSAEHLGELVESEWVSRDNETYAMTERGITSFSRLREVVGRNRDTLSQGISEAEYDATLDVLERMARNLGWQG